MSKKELAHDSTQKQFPQNEKFVQNFFDGFYDM